MSYVDEYLASLPADQRAILQHIREIVHATVPDVEETKSYGLPAFKLSGKYLFAFQKFKHHYSVFPSSQPIALLAHELEAFETSKGTVKFTAEKPIPDKLLRQMLLIHSRAIRAQNK